MPHHRLRLVAKIPVATGGTAIRGTAIRGTAIRGTAIRAVRRCGMAIRRYLLGRVLAVLFLPGLFELFILRVFPRFEVFAVENPGGLGFNGATGSITGFIVSIHE